MPVHSVVATSPVGGTEGTMFQDVCFRNAKGLIIINCPQPGLVLDAKHPIQKIAVYSNGHVVHGIAITYQLLGKDHVTLTHGSEFCETPWEVTLNDDEKLVGVFGCAGFYHPECRELVNDIGFVIFDEKTRVTRVEEPIRVDDNGQVNLKENSYYSSDVIAFGGFAQDTDQFGLSGLFFYKDGEIQ